VEDLIGELAGAGGRAGEIVARGIVDLGPAAVGPLLRALSGSDALSVSLREATGRSLDRLPATLAARHAGSGRLDSAERRELLVGLALLSARGTAADLPTATRLAHPASSEGSPHRDLGRAVEETVGAILARDDRALARVRAMMGEAHPLVRERIVRAVGSARADGGGLAVLGDLLGRYPSLDLCLLCEIASVTAAVGGPYEWSLLHRVRTALDHSDPAVRRAAVSCLGRMEDHEAVSTLVELLDDESEGVRETAAWALERITRRRFGLQRERWSLWIEAEASWWRGEAAELLGMIEHGADAEVIAALAEIAGHRLYRDELSSAVAACLDRAEGAVVRVACSTLQGLASPRAVEPLIGLLDHADAQVRASAHRALRGITGRGLPPDAAAWKSSVTAGARGFASRTVGGLVDED
jgi:hypothetical protein